MSFFKKSPEEVAELDRLAKYEALVAELQKGITTAAAAVKAAEDRQNGDRLMRDRRRARVDTTKQKIQAEHDRKRDERAKHAAALDIDESFDLTPFDLAIARETAELETRTEIMLKQDAVFAEGVSLLAEAKRELRRARHRLAIADLTEHTHAMRQKVAAAAALEGDGVASATVEMGLAQFMASTVGTENLVSMYLTPPAHKAIDFSGAVVFLHDTTNINGPLDGRGYGAGEGASFDPDTAARLVACGAAHWLKDTPENTKAAEQARKRLEQRPTYEGSARENVGWQSNG